MKSKFAIALTALVLVAALLGAAVNQSQAAKGVGSKALEGSWDIKLTSVSNSVPPFDEFITFTSGGGMVETNNAFPPAAASPGHGTWEHDGDQTFKFTFYKLLFLGPQGQFTGRLRVRGTIVLNGPNAWTGLPATVDILDPAGNVIPNTTDFVSAEATRIAVVPQ
jgi:hypothetical protein